MHSLGGEHTRGPSTWMCSNPEMHQESGQLRHVQRQVSSKFSELKDTSNIRHCSMFTWGSVKVVVSCCLCKVTAKPAQLRAGTVFSEALCFDMSRHGQVVACQLTFWSAVTLVHSLSSHLVFSHPPAPGIAEIAGCGQVTHSWSSPESCDSQLKGAPTFFSHTQCP